MKSVDSTFVTLAAIRIHLRDPLGALENAISFTGNPLLSPSCSNFIGENLQICHWPYSMPDKAAQTPRGWTWWQMTAGSHLRFWS